MSPVQVAAQTADIVLDFSAATPGTISNKKGVVIPNTWLMSMDYSGINYDYNDNVYLISKIKPESL